MNETNKAIPTFYPENRKDWRKWLIRNHDQMDSVWLIYDKKAINNQRLTWIEAVEEALCFGWIDSRSKPIDKEKYMQFFSKRKAKSNWSKINKEKVEFLTRKGLMADAGLKAIEQAKQNGYWAILDAVETLTIPEDLANAFIPEPLAGEFYNALSKSVKKQILLWLITARKEETRQKRITELAKELSAGNLPRSFLT